VAAPRRRASRDFAIEAALALVTVLLVAPLVHKAHMLWIMLAYAAVFAAGRPDIPRAHWSRATP